MHNARRPLQTSHRFALLSITMLHACALLASPAAAQTTTAKELPHFGILIPVPDGAAVTTRQVEQTTMTGVRIPNGVGDIIIQQWQVTDGVRGNFKDYFRDFDRDNIGIADLEWRLIAAPLGLAVATPDFDAAARGTKAGRLLVPVTEAAVAGRATRVVSLVLEPGEGETDRVYKAFCIFPRTADQFIVFEFITPTPKAESGLTVFRAFLESVAVLDAAGDGDTAVATAERAAVDALLDLTFADYEAAATAAGERIERLYEIDPTTGEIREHGYRQIRFWPGRYGELTDKPPRRWRRQDERPGILMKANAKLFLDNGAIATTESLAFLGDSRRDEFWSLTVAVQRKGTKAPDLFNEHGFRDGSEMTVSVDAGNGEVAVMNPVAGKIPRADDNAIRPGASIQSPSMRIEGFLSRVERELLPYLLARRGEPGTFAFTAYDSQAEAVQPLGVILTAKGDADDGTTGWEMRLPSPDADTSPRTFSLNADGEPRRARLTDGRIWEPIEPEKLRAIYRAKGIPTD